MYVGPRYVRMPMSALSPASFMSYQMIAIKSYLEAHKSNAMGNENGQHHVAL